MPRPIDHLVLAVTDLSAAAERYRAMGFTVGSRNLHPWGTENAVVQLEDVYLELIGLAEGCPPPPPDDPAAPFAGLVAAAVARGGGLCAVALGSDDADADAAGFRAAGLGRGRRLDFARDSRTPEGAPRRLRFSLAFADLPGLPDAGIFTCRHHQPFGDAAARCHDNRATRLGGVVLAVEDPRRHAPALAILLDAAPRGVPGRPSFDTPTGRLDLMAPADADLRCGPGTIAGRFAAASVFVEALPPLRAVLDRGGVPHAEVAGAVVVPPEAAFGVALAFAPAPCHSLARSGGGTA